ncbi:putative F-box domain, FBD domain, leucine-rich repeat domain superfamily [Helianthus annuus]|uniref:F-box domain, FBD domain, leucine-rich repeat domain superfamily n=2 Tax=Helianthus annuus TaxID=4232 RepID=A0A9K3DKY8_HELAN|nr:FBD-associated F-box protein At4g10400 [Helianthus annuus]KAF5757170.1 putative F-box domain, FBD domain, leucine-rich repeat domain superfamily [Helianthus annuus]
MSYTIRNVDRLSSLPEEVHSHILSLMPTKYAVRTSILSRTWRYRWMLVTNLDFDDSHPFHDLDCFMQFVDRVLELQKSPQIKSFRMCFSEMWVKKSKVLKWIDAAVRLHVSELDVKAMLLELPLCLFTCRTLTKLRIDHDTQYEEVWECPSLVNLPFLKTLDIVVFKNPIVNAFKLIPGCPMLESLSLHVQCCNNEDDYIFNIATLKRLKLTFNKAPVVHTRVVLHVPNLEYLSIGGGSIFVMEDMPSLVEASVGFGDTKVDRWVEFLKRITGIKSLSIRYAPFTSPLPVFPKLSHLELPSFCLTFLESSPELKHLCFGMSTNSHWGDPKSVPECMVTTLTTIKVLNCNGQKCDIQLLEYLLGNAEVLKRLTITWGWGHTCSKTEEQMQLAAQLLKVPRASQHCEIHFLGN